MKQKRLKVLMFGWEFPPYSSGGLGTACLGLSRGLVRNGTDLTFVLPSTRKGVTEDYMKIIYSGDEGGKKKVRIKEGEMIGKIEFRTIKSTLMPYITSKSYSNSYCYSTSRKDGDDKEVEDERKIYGDGLFSEVFRYAKEARKIAKKEDFDIIHCHDWLTCLCGIEARKVMQEKKYSRNVPMILHVHATEFDRTCGNPNKAVYELEQKGVQEADYIITVSNYTKDIVCKNYNVSRDKITVIHNSIEPEFEHILPCDEFEIKKHHKVVLFLGRLTIQKGPDHFLSLAKRIIDVDNSVRFVVSGSGDMFKQVIEEAAKLGIGDKVLFTDFLKGDDVNRAYRMADVYVMPSISEPFGLSTLEAMKNGVPVVISKQSGVSEVVRNCLVSDFWDIDDMSNKILAILNHSELSESLRSGSLKEIKNFTWDTPAKDCIKLYKKAIEKLN